MFGIMARGGKKSYLFRCEFAKILKHAKLMADIAVCTACTQVVMEQEVLYFQINEQVRLSYSLCLSCIVLVEKYGAGRG